MDLELEAYRAILRVKKAHAEKELKEYQYVLQFAKSEMPVFERLLEIIENLYKDIKFYETKLKEI